MRIVALPLALFLLATPQVRAQEQSVGWASKLFRGDDGKIPTGHDFKTVPRGAMLQFRFPMKNIYAVPLQITTSVSCGCVTATPNPPTLEPNGSGTLDLTMDTNKFIGDKTVTVEVRVMHPQYWSSAYLTIHAFCRGDVMLEPSQAVFGSVPVGQPATREVMVRYSGVQPWQITGIAAGQTAPFDVRYQEAYRQAGQVGYKVKLTLKTDAAAGSLKGDLQLTTNDPNYPVVLVPYDAMVQAPLTASPEVVRFGSVPIGASVEKRVNLRGNQAYRITKVDGEGDGLTVKDSRPDPATVHVLVIKFQPSQAGPIQRTLTVHTSLAGGATATIRVEGTAVTPGQ